MNNFSKTKELISEATSEWSNFERFLKRVDWHFSKSDDQNAWKKGKAQTDKAKAMYKKLAKIDKQKANSLWDQYAPETHKIKNKADKSQDAKDEKDLFDISLKTGAWYGIISKDTHAPISDIKKYKANTEYVAKVYKKASKRVQDHINHSLQLFTQNKFKKFPDFVKAMDTYSKKHLG